MSSEIEELEEVLRSIHERVKNRVWIKKTLQEIEGWVGGGYPFSGG